MIKVLIRLLVSKILEMSEVNNSLIMRSFLCFAAYKAAIIC